MFLTLDYFVFETHSYPCVTYNSLFISTQIGLNIFIYQITGTQIPLLITLLVNTVNTVTK